MSDSHLHEEPSEILSLPLFFCAKPLVKNNLFGSRAQTQQMSIEYKAINPSGRDAGGWSKQTYFSLHISKSVCNKTASGGNGAYGSDRNKHNRSLEMPRGRGSRGRDFSSLCVSC